MDRRATACTRSIFAMLDEACRAPSGSDEKYVASMINAFSDKKYAKLFSKQLMGSKAIGPDLGQEMAKKQFIVKHFAEDVAYTAHNWLEKNRGKLHPDLATVMTNSESVFVQDIMPPPEPEGAKGPTVSGAFRKSLSSLAATMTVTHQHFIRCIKPNQQKVPFRLEGLNVIRQLRYLGVPAVVEINRTPARTRPVVLRARRMLTPALAHACGRRWLAR
jgi:myosin heavy subunit